MTALSLYQPRATLQSRIRRAITAHARTLKAMEL